MGNFNFGVAILIALGTAVPFVAIPLILYFVKFEREGVSKRKAKLILLLNTVIMATAGTISATSVGISVWNVLLPAIFWHMISRMVLLRAAR